MTWSFPMYGRVGLELESPPPDVAQPTNVMPMARASSAESGMLILRHRSCCPIPGSGEMLEEREIDLAVRLLSRRGVLNAYGCFMVQGSCDCLVGTKRQVHCQVDLLLQRLIHKLQQ